MSQQERVSWVSLIVTLVVGVWYFGRVLGLPADANLQSGAMARFATDLIFIAIVLGIAGELLLRWAQRRVQGDAGENATALDERDALIDLKAIRNAFYVLFFGIIIVLGQIALIEMTQQWMAGRHRIPPAAETMLQQILTGPLSALHVAQLLLLVTTLSGAATYISRIVYYRRGY